MSRADLDARYQELVDAGQSESLEARVLNTFFGHPSMVGSPSAGGSRPLDLTHSGDREMYFRAVREKFDRLLNELHFWDKPKAKECYDKYRALL